MKEILYVLLIVPLVAVKCVEEKRFIIDSIFGGHASSAGHLGVVYISTHAVGTEWVTTGLPRMTFLYIFNKRISKSWFILPVRHTLEQLIYFHPKKAIQLPQIRCKVSV